ncbi:MAG TPA: hypothetical protein VK211_05460 [Kamptonema sp.]|nr:hypothetical protein [Kamptonema sp.]
MRRSVLISLVIVAALLISRPFVSYFALMYLPQGRALAIVVGCTMALWIRDRNQKGSLPSWLVSPQIRLGWVATTLGLIVLLMLVHHRTKVNDCDRITQPS